MNTLEARAQFEGTELDVYVRVGRTADGIYLDLGDTTWQAVEITPDGWKVVKDVPVRFRRAPGMRALPLPTARGSMEMLRRFVNVEDDAAFSLLAAWLVAAMRPSGPFPVLVIQGEQGTCKSTLAEVCRALVDPASVGLRSKPRNDQDLMIAAQNNWILSFDNLSFIPDWLSDALCGLSTGGGFSVRKLYTDADEVLFYARRPLILNGISDPAHRDDLKDRSIVLTLQPVPDSARQTEHDFWSSFELTKPAILGALLDGVSAGLGNLATTKLRDTPRMADFAQWAEATEEGLGLQAGTFRAAYGENRRLATAAFLEADAVSRAICEWSQERSEEIWCGTASKLLEVLDQFVGEDNRRRREWPKAAHVLSAKLRRAGPALRKAGFLIERERGQQRIITIRRVPQSSDVSVESDAGKPMLDAANARDAGSLQVSVFNDNYEGVERAAIQEENA